MPVDVKICGLSTAETLAAAVGAGADMVGCNFFPPSPRAVTAERAGELAADLPSSVLKVGVFFDEEMATISRCAQGAQLDIIQVHGTETPERVSEIRDVTGLPVMKVIKLRTPEDLDAIEDFIQVADRLLFDTKPPPEMTDALPGGNAISFDWRILEGRDWPLPWMLAGGLTPENLAQAVATTGATALDVSSGVESRPGVKEPALIEAFLRTAKAL